MDGEAIGKARLRYLGVSAQKTRLVVDQVRGRNVNEALDVLRHSPKGSGRWDAKAVGTPWVVPMPDGSFRMYYVGGPEGGQDELSGMHLIGMPVSEGSDFRRWHRLSE